MPLIYDRKTGEIFSGDGPRSGVYSQISMKRLCETLEACGEIAAHERITHLEIAGDYVRYRLEQRS